MAYHVTANTVSRLHFMIIPRFLSCSLITDFSKAFEINKFQILNDRRTRILLEILFSKFVKHYVIAKCRAPAYSPALRHDRLIVQWR